MIYKTVPRKGGIHIDTTSNILEIPVWEKINLTIKEAAAYSNIGETTIRDLLHEKGCPFLFKVGKKHLVKRDEFEKYFKNRHYL